jgi:hypothetical protein
VKKYCSLIEVDGTMKIVDYTADHYDFKAKVKKVRLSCTIVFNYTPVSATKNQSRSGRTT